MRCKIIPAVDPAAFQGMVATARTSSSPNGRRRTSSMARHRSIAHLDPCPETQGLTYGI
ncbi:hypothetical protein [Thermobaculum terrenum]|uniref:hypothetical protein n=1 Tax=Thermobaculum terrenum TaxID=166501 RepID=UPI00145DD710|nr:hypothetical protein [Thermobaculum terrenum]